MREIRLHGRGGQGAVLASEMLVYALVQEGRYANAIPYFGFERRGAPLAAFVRCDERPIREKTQVYQPHCLIVMDATLRRAINLFEGLREGGIVVWNGRHAPDRSLLPATAHRLGLVDASAIAREVLGSPITNTPMLGAFVATTGWVSLASLTAALRWRLDPALAEANVHAATLANERTQVIDLP